MRAERSWRAPPGGRLSPVGGRCLASPAGPAAPFGLFPGVLSLESRESFLAACLTGVAARAREGESGIKAAR